MRISMWTAATGPQSSTSAQVRATLTSAAFAAAQAVRSLMPKFVRLEMLTIRPQLFAGIGGKRSLHGLDSGMEVEREHSV